MNNMNDEGTKIYGGDSSSNKRLNKSIDEKTQRINGISEETQMYKFNAKEFNKTLKEEENQKKKNMGKKKRKKVKKNKKKNILLALLKKLIIAVIILGILAGLIVAGILAGIFLGFFGADFKMTKEDLKIEFSNSEVYDADGNLLCTLNGNEKRKIVSLQDMPEYLPKAYVAIEDERFYEHNGVDIKRTGAATVTFALNAGKSSLAEVQLLNSL